MTNIAKCSGWRAFAAIALVLTLTWPSLAADYTTWRGGKTGNWNVADNWDSGLPTEAVYARFSSSYTTPFTVTLNDPVKVYGFALNGSRTASATITGTGVVATYRTGGLFNANSSPSRLILDVNVTNASDHAQTILGNLSFRKDFYVGTNCELYVGNTSGDAASVAFAGNADVTAKNIRLYSGASLAISNNAQVSLEYDLITYPGANLIVSGNSVIRPRQIFLPFSPAAGVDDEWVMDGGTLCATNTTTHRLVLSYTNAVKTISGTGTFILDRLYFSYATNVTLRLNGPDVYVRQNPAGANTVLKLSNGSTVGAWGQNMSLVNVTTVIDGEAVFDTTDHQDGETARKISTGSLQGDGGNGNLTVKGNGTLSFPSTSTQANFGLVGKDSVTITCPNTSGFYALGDLVLTDSAILTTPCYIGHKGYAEQIVKSLTMDEQSTLEVGRYMVISGDATLSGNASAVIQNSGNVSGAFTCANLSLSDNASLVVTGTVVSTSLSMSGNAHLAFTAGAGFTAGAAFGEGNWTMEIRIPAGYEAGIRPIVKGVAFDESFTNHVTLVGETEGWSVRTIAGMPILYKEAEPSGVEWTGGSATSDNWSDAANWNGGNVPTALDLAAFGGLTRLTPVNDSVSSVSGIVFRASAGPFVLSGSGQLSLTANCGSRSGANVNNAMILSHSAFDQTVAQPLDLGKHHAFLRSDSAALNVTGGISTPETGYNFVICGDVRVGGTCSIGIFSFKNSVSGTPSCLTVLPGGSFTCKGQNSRSMAESVSYVGHVVVEEGGEMVVKGECSFLYGELENVIDGTLSVISGSGTGGVGRFAAGPQEQYYVGKGTIYADAARAGRVADAANHYVNFGGTLKLYMNGNWNTASYYVSGTTTNQIPNYPTRFRMADGTTLGATANWTYGPAANAYNTVAATVTPADRTAVMSGTVTVDTQNPTNDAAHTITFVDPLDASDATLVKTGAGTLAFTTPAGYPSQISNLTVNAGTVRIAGDAAPVLRDLTVGAGATASFAAVPTLSGTLTIASTDSNLSLDGSESENGWYLIATAADIATPNGATAWRASNGRQAFKVVTDVAGTHLYGNMAKGTLMIFR